MLKPLLALAVALSAILFAEEPKVVPSATSPAPLPTAPVVPRPPAPPVSATRPPNQEWLSILERLRAQPRAGEISNGMLSSPLMDIFSDSAEAKARASAIASDYEKALLERAAKWESELNDLRAQYDAKLLAELAEGRREQARKFLDLSRSKWTESAARDGATRAAFLERMRTAPRYPAPAPKAPGPNGAPPTPPSLPGQPNNEAATWMRDERLKAMKQDDEGVKVLRELLTPDEAARFDRHNRARPAPPATTPAGPASSAAPFTAAPRTPTIPATPPIPPAASAIPEKK